jgi:hypothetical protein
MNRIITLIICILSLYVNGQNNALQIIQMSIDFQILQNHLDSQNIINTGRVELIKDNGLVENSLNLTYRSAPLRLNNGKGFFNHWTFEFIDVEVKSKKAHVSYKYIPNWNYCEVVPILSQSDRLFFVIYLDFKLNEDGWTINNYSIEDIDFGQTFDENPIKCIKDLYKPIR